MVAFHAKDEKTRCGWPHGGPLLAPSLELLRDTPSPKVSRWHTTRVLIPKRDLAYRSNLYLNPGLSLSPAISMRAKVSKNSGRWCAPTPMQGADHTRPAIITLGKNPTRHPQFSRFPPARDSIAFHRRSSVGWLFDFQQLREGESPVVRSRAKMMSLAMLAIFSLWATGASAARPRARCWCYPYWFAEPAPVAVIVPQASPQTPPTTAAVPYSTYYRAPSGDVTPAANTTYYQSSGTATYVMPYGGGKGGYYGRAPGDISTSGSQSGVSEPVTDQPAAPLSW
jgi:hypothetical protein